MVWVRGNWAISVLENSNSRHEVEMGFSNDWGWRDRKYGINGNKNSGQLKLKLHMKQDSKGFLLCDAPFCPEG